MRGGQYQLETIQENKEAQEGKDNSVKYVKQNFADESNTDVLERDVEDPETQCGMGSCKPEGLQFCASMQLFVFFFSVMSIFTQSNTVYLSSQITSVEKQFKLSSTYSGTLLSCNEIGQLSVVLLISHFGHNGHIPRILSSLSIVYSVAMITTAVPYFVDPFELPADPEELNTTDSGDSRYCSAVNNTMDGRADNTVTSTAGIMWALYIIGASIAVQGLGKAPKRSLTSTYVDNNVSDRTKTGLYLGTTVAASILGPSFAILIGSAMSSLPVDLSDTKLLPTDPRWVGCWWLGFVAFGLVGIIVSVPGLFYPKRLADAAPIPKEKDLDTEEEPGSIISSLKRLPISLLRVFRKPVYVFTLISICFINFSVTGIVFFGPKYLQTQFYLPAWKANLIHGSSHIVTAVIGTFTGGLVTSKFKMGRLKCLKFLLLVTSLSSLCTIATIFTGCNDQSVIGLDEHLSRPVIHTDIPCFCDKSEYFPVCSEGHQTFLNPCVAECWNMTETSYGDCKQVNGRSVLTGMCDMNCDIMFYLFLVFSLLQSLLGTLSIMPNFLVIIRTVDERDKSMAIGVMVFVTSILGWLPAPIVYGAVIDGTCRLWENTTGGNKGSCQMYFLEDLRYRFVGLESVLKSISFLLFILVFFICRKEERKTESKQKASDTKM